MIYAIKHKSGKYLAGAMGRVFEPDIKRKGVRFTLVTSLKDARLIEDPDMDVIYAMGLEPVPVKLNKGLEVAHKVYNV